MEHEKLEVYRQLMKVAGGLAKRVAKWPRGYGYLADQLRRAMASSILTLAEGNAKRTSRPERRRFFEMSLGSIAEVGASLDLACVFGLISANELDTFKSALKLAYFKVNALP